eukprot:SAG31_NODE_3883_length_3786_cov_3.919989_3_plen_138_part_00
MACHNIILLLSDAPSHSAASCWAGVSIWAVDLMVFLWLLGIKGSLQMIFGSAVTVVATVASSTMSVTGLLSTVGISLAGREVGNLLSVGVHIHNKAVDNEYFVGCAAAVLLLLLPVLYWDAVWPWPFFEHRIESVVS